MVLLGAFALAAAGCSNRGHPPLHIVRGAPSESVVRIVPEAAQYALAGGRTGKSVRIRVRVANRLDHPVSVAQCADGTPAFALVEEFRGEWHEVYRDPCVAQSQSQPIEPGTSREFVVAVTHADDGSGPRVEAAFPAVLAVRLSLLATQDSGDSLNALSDEYILAQNFFLERE